MRTTERGSPRSAGQATPQAATHSPPGATARHVVQPTTSRWRTNDSTGEPGTAGGGSWSCSASARRRNLVRSQTVKIWPTETSVFPSGRKATVIPAGKLGISR
jgi:hypothetical protein